MSVKTWQDGGVDNLWSTAGNWVEGTKPAADDDVVISAAYNCVVDEASANLNSFDMTGYTNTLSGNKNIVVQPASGTVTALLAGTVTWTGAFRLNPQGTSVIEFTLNGNSIGGVYVGIVASSGTVEQQDAISLGVTDRLSLYHSFSGTYNSNGYAISGGYFEVTDGFSGTGDFTDSTITVGQDKDYVFDVEGHSGTLTFTGSTINLSKEKAGFIGNGETYNTVNFLKGQTHLVTGANTFGTLSFTGEAAKTGILNFAADQTVTGTFNIDGNSSVNRILIKSNVLGTARSLTLTGATISGCTNIDFQDIAFVSTGAVDFSAITGLSGDCGGNSISGGGALSFTASTEQHWTNADGGNWSTVGNWTSRIPLPQDDCTFDVAFNASKTVTIDAGAPIRSGRNIDWSGATVDTALTWTNSATHTIYGNFTLKTGMTLSGTNSVSFEGRGAQTITSSGVTITHQMQFNSYGGSYTLQDALINTQTAGVHIYAGTFSAGTSNVTVFGIYSAETTYARTIVMGTGTWTLNGTGLVWKMFSSNLTYTKGGELIISNTTDTSKTFYGAGKTYGEVTFSGDNILIENSSSFDTLNVNTAGLTNGLFLKQAQTQTIGAFTTNGSAGNLAKMTGYNSAAATVSYSGVGNVSVDYMDLTYITAAEANTWYAGDNSNDGGNNTNWIFTVPPLTNILKVAGVAYDDISKITGVAIADVQKVIGVE